MFVFRLNPLLRSMPPVALLLLSACAPSLSELRQINPPALDFAGAMASEYQDFAASEDERGHVLTAERFAAKGLRALRGEDVPPDAVEPSADAAQREALAEARADLMEALTPSVKDAAPQELARAQLLYDCWNHYAAEAPTPERSLCEQQFNAALDDLIDVAGLSSGRGFQRPFVFAENQLALTAEHKAMVDDVASHVLSLAADSYWVQLKAYVGKKSAQRKLTESRLYAVKKALVASGVPARQVRVVKVGSAKAVYLSRDDVAHDTKVVTLTVIPTPQPESKEPQS